ncbi:hypothetical protein HPB51_009449 [Rhipicephalus microplus]|uniref:Uncharacterized protein n=2 Tax=Rhipicephalus microplus TaxID=6941 RepID=A0A9J6DTH2_RHIMP|nr:hypothetical protein HPB51_009449 [Rhipicephalus microplus]
MWASGGSTFVELPVAATGKSLKMSESHFDEYEHYNFDQDKFLYAGHSGKQRSKREASEHTNHHDPSGHVRKLVTKMANTERNRRNSGGNRH